MPNPPSPTTASMSYFSAIVVPTICSGSWGSTAQVLIIRPPRFASGFGGLTSVHAFGDLEGRSLELLVAVADGADVVARFELSLQVGDRGAHLLEHGFVEQIGVAFEGLVGRVNERFSLVFQLG